MSACSVLLSDKIRDIHKRSTHSAVIHHNGFTLQAPGRIVAISNSARPRSLIVRSALVEHVIQVTQRKVLPLIQRKHFLHGVSTKKSKKVPESLLKPSPPSSLIKSSGERNRDRNLAELSNIELVRMAVKYERNFHHHLCRTVSACNTGQQPMLSTSTYWPISAEHTKRRQWSL